ncbi:hypothetical protein [Agreia bicolorata]
MNQKKIWVVAVSTSRLNSTAATASNNGQSESPITNDRADQAS